MTLCHVFKQDGQDGLVWLSLVPETFGLSVQDKQFKIHFLHDDCGGHLGFLIGTILAIFYFFLTKFPNN